MGEMCVFRGVCVLLCVTVSVCLNLLEEPVTFSGPTGSLFGFSVDFHSAGSTLVVVIGAPKANTSQPGVTEGGGVFMCTWSPEGGCRIIDFDLKGDEEHISSDLRFYSFKSQQWFGASVRSVSSTHLLACAPLFHWNAKQRGEESGKTPVGNCLLMDYVTNSSTPFSPCRGSLMDNVYKRMNNRNDQRYCEVGFSTDITKEGRLVLGAPGSFYFQGQVMTVGVSDIINSGQSNEPFQYVTGIHQSDEQGGYDLYRGYSVASGLLTGDSTPDYVVGVPNDMNSAGTVCFLLCFVAPVGLGQTVKSVKIYDGRRSGSLRAHHTFLGAQVASYFGHSVAVGDINSDGLDDVLVGAPLFMDRVMEQLQERGQVLLYLQKRGASFNSKPDQTLIGQSLYGRFGSSITLLGDLDMDGYQDVAVGAPWSGDRSRGQVFIYLGHSNGLSAMPSQVIDSPLLSSGSAFGFSLRSGVDIDGNGYPDLLVGAWGADKAFLYRSQAVIRSRVSVSLQPDFLNPDVKLCNQRNTSVSCFYVQVCVHVSGHRMPQQTAIRVGLQLDTMKQPMTRRTLLLSTNQPHESMKLIVERQVGLACTNHTAYLRSEDEVRDKLSPIFITAEVSLHNSTRNALLHGQTHSTVQSRLILDCGDDNVCIPDLKLSAKPLSDSVLVGDDQSVFLSVSAKNDGEGAYETELVVVIPEHTHFQSSQGVNRLVCVQRKENLTVVVTCDLGNPMKQGQKVLTDLLFSVGHLEEVESHINFSLRIRSKNSVNSSSNHVTVRVQVKAEATLEIRGGSVPSEVLLHHPDWQPMVTPGRLEEIGPLVEHVYEVRLPIPANHAYIRCYNTLNLSMRQSCRSPRAEGDLLEDQEIRNQGPSSVNARLTVDFPSTWRHHFLLYVISTPSEESLSCRTLNTSEVLPLEVQGNFSVAPVATSIQQEETNSLRETVHVNCSSRDTGCVRFEYDVMDLGRGFSAVIKISARLSLKTLMKTPYLNYDLISSASYEVISAPSKVQPLLLTSGKTQTQLSVVWRPPDGEKPPIGYIILSAISGLLLLCLLCFVFWKLGFFRRTRPPTDDEDGVGEDHGVQELAEESHITE